MRDERLVEIGWEILNEMYKEAEPPLDFPKFRAKVEKSKKCPKDWQQKHYLPESRYDAIINEYTIKYKLSKNDLRRMVWMFLDYSPTTVASFVQSI